MGLFFAYSDAFNLKKQELWNARHYQNTCVRAKNNATFSTPCAEEASSKLIAATGSPIKDAQIALILKSIFHIILPS